MNYIVTYICQVLDLTSNIIKHVTNQPKANSPHSMCRQYEKCSILKTALNVFFHMLGKASNRQGGYVGDLSCLISNPSPIVEDSITTASHEMLISESLPALTHYRIEG